MEYRIEALQVLLNKDCILERYYPLIPYKEALIRNLRALHCGTKSECGALSVEELMKAGLPSSELAVLFRKFLTMYDVPDRKFKEIEAFAANEAEDAAFRELYLLPGVRATRAKLYYDAGYGTLSSIACGKPEQIMRDTTSVIDRNASAMIAPQPKEVRTHIAVAKVLCEYGVEQ